MSGGGFCASGPGICARRAEHRRGQAGARKEDVFCAIALACGFGAVVVALVQVIAEPVVGRFTPDAAVTLAGGQYRYIWDSFFAGVQFSFSGYFCACGRSGLSFLHNFLSIVLARIPGAYAASRLFAQTLLPMGLANAAGSLFSILVCVCAYLILTRRREPRLQED